MTDPQTPAPTTAAEPGQPTTPADTATSTVEEPSTPGTLGAEPTTATTP